MIIAIILALMTWQLGKRSTACGVTFGIGAVALLIFLFAISITIGGTLTIK